MKPICFADTSEFTSSPKVNMDEQNTPIGFHPTLKNNFVRMKKSVVLLWLLLYGWHGIAQTVTNPLLKELIQTELEFSKTAKQTNTRQAFLNFTNDSSIGFRNTPLSLRKEYEKREIDSSWLWWEPDFADISFSGDFGFTTGPWEYRSNKNDLNPVSHGHFFTIWKKYPQEGWKVLIDLGISYKQTIKRESIQISQIKTSKILVNQKDSLQILDKLLAETNSQTGKIGYFSMISVEPRFYEEGQIPFLNSQSILSLLEKRTAITLQPIGSFIATSGDLGVTYGFHQLKSQTSGSIYFHVWKKENTSWKLLVEVFQ